MEFHNAVHHNAQAMEVRFMELGPNEELYTVSGRYTVQRWHREEAVPRETWTTRKPINAFVVRDTGDYTHAFLAHDRGETKMWRRRNFGENRAFRPQATLETVRNRMSNLLPVVSNPTENTITCLCLSDDRDFIYTASTKGVLYVWWIDNAGDDKFSDSIRGYNGEVLSLAAGPNVIFSGSSDGHIRMYKREPRGPGAARYEVRHREIGDYPVTGPIHTRVTALVFETRDDDVTRGRLYAGSTDGRVRCWKNLRVDALAAWPAVEIMEYHTGAVTCLALCSDRFVFSGSNDGKICVWRRGAGNGNHTTEMVLAGDHNPINRIATQKDTWTEFPEGAPERWILYGGSLDALRIWHVQYEPFAIQSEILVPGQRFRNDALKGPMREEGTSSRSRNTDNPSSSGGSNDGTDKGTTSSNIMRSSIRVPHINRRGDLYRITQQQMEIRMMEPNLRGKLYIVSGNTEVRESWQHHIFYQDGLRDPPVFRTRHPINAIAVKVTDEGLTYVYCAHNKGRVSVRRRVHNLIAQTGFVEMGTLQTQKNSIRNSFSRWRGPPEYDITCLRLSDDQRILYSASSSGTIYTWALYMSGYGFIGKLQGHSGHVLALEVGVNVVFSGSSDGIMRVWRREERGGLLHRVTHRLIGSLHTRDNTSVLALAFRQVTPTTGWLYAGSSDGVIRCWRDIRLDVNQIEIPNPEIMQSNHNAITCLALSSGPFVLSGSVDGSIYVWRVDDGIGSHTFYLKFEGHATSINCISTDMDDVRTNRLIDLKAPPRWSVLSSSPDKTLGMWHVLDQPL